MTEIGDQRPETSSSVNQWFGVAAELR